MYKLMEKSIGCALVMYSLILTQVPKLTYLHVDHVGRWVNHPERAVDLKGVRKRAPLEPLAEHELEDVSRGDVLLGGRDRVQELGLRGRGSVNIDQGEGIITGRLQQLLMT